MSFAQVGSTLVDMPLQCKAPQALGSKGDSERLRDVKLLGEESSTLIINSIRRFNNKDWLEEEALRLEAIAVKAVEQEAVAALAEAAGSPPASQLRARPAGAGSPTRLVSPRWFHVLLNSLGNSRRGSPPQNKCSTSLL